MKILLTILLGSFCICTPFPPIENPLQASEKGIYWRCKKCNTINSNGSIKCFRCGATQKPGR